MAVLLSLSPARASPIPDPDDRRPVPTRLYLAVTVNEVAQDGLVPFEQIDGRLHATGSTLRRLGFALEAPDTGALLAVETIAGVHVRYDPATQAVRIDAPLDVLALSSTRLGRQADESAVVTDRAPGMLLNYDLYASDSSGGWNASGFGELRIFGMGSAIVSTTGVGRVFRPDGERRQHDSVRLDSRIQWSFPDAAVSVIVGDTFTGFLDWTRPVRIGGIQVGRNFALQPYRITIPLPEFLGEATVPSNVELYVNGLRQYTGSTPPGPFQLAPVPGVNGAGNARVVVTDAYGRVNTLDFPFYSTQRLLAAGLSDWSLGLGQVRERYGIASFQYADTLVGSGSLRYGVNNQLTTEAHVEGSDGLVTAGAGGAWLAGMAGVFNAAYAHSRADTQRGSQFTLGWSWSDSRYQFAADTRRTRGDYRDVAALYGPPPPSRTERAVAGISTRAGNLGVTWVRLDQATRDREDGVAGRAPDRARYAGLYWSHGFANGWYASASINQGLDADRDRSAYLGLMVPLGRQGERQAALSWQRDTGGDSAVVDVSRPVPGDGGAGWRVQARAGGLSGGLAEGAWQGSRGRIGGGMSRAGDNRFTYAQASGSLVGMGGGLFAARAITDAFAVVSAGGYAGVPVALENRRIGQTDDRGLLLVAPLNAWQHNRLSIDPMDLPADIRVTDAARLATPAQGAGVRVGFEVRRVRAVMIELLDADGAPLPVGSRIKNAPAGMPDQVGYDGQVYAEDLPGGTVLRIGLPAGGVCTASVPATPAGIARHADTLSLRCVPESVP